MTALNSKVVAQLKKVDKVLIVICSYDRDAKHGKHIVSYVKTKRIKVNTRT